MKKFLAIAGIVSLSFIFSGCPYESAVPIDAPSVKVDPKLLGTWEKKDHSDRYKVTAQDDYRYSIAELNEQSEEKSKMMGYVSLVKGTSFLNLWEPNDSSISYSFYKMEVRSDGSLVLADVTENIDEKFATSKELKKFIADNMKHSYFFSKEQITLTHVGN